LVDSDSSYGRFYRYLKVILKEGTGAMQKTPHHLLLTISGLLALNACTGGYTPHPRAIMFETSSQQKLESASHWSMLAAHEATKIQEILPGDALLGLPGVNLSRSPFEQAYRNMLTSHLVSSGVKVALSPASAKYRLDYDIQVVRHTSRDTLVPRPGTATAFYAIGRTASNVHKWSKPYDVWIPVTIGAEVLTLLWRDTEETITEVVVNNRVHDGVQLLTASSNVYYFSDDDLHNYTGGGKTFSVVAASDTSAGGR